jgi:uncharacterized protein YicC (UPF0701 family)
MDMQQLLANQEKAEANAKVNKEDMLAKLQANRESDREELKGMINENLNYLKEDIKSRQAEMRSTYFAMRSELKETIQHEMKAIRSEVVETTTCN